MPPCDRSAASLPQRFALCVWYSAIECSVLRWALHAADYEYFHRGCGGFQLQAKLLLNRIQKGCTRWVGPAHDLLTSDARLSESGTTVLKAELQRQIVQTFELCPVEHWTSSVAFDPIGEIGHGYGITGYCH